MTGQPKRHHFVPQTYMAAWADSADQVAVRRRGAEQTFTPNIANILVERHLYGSGKDAERIEGWFSEIEGSWPGLRELLINSDGLDESARTGISLFIAIQVGRTPDKLAQIEFTENVIQFCNTEFPTRVQVGNYLRERHLGFSAEAAEIEAAWTLVTAVVNMFGSDQNISRIDALAITIRGAVENLIPIIAERRWQVEHCRKRILITSDRPITNWSPPNRMDQFLGVGLGNAAEVRLPIGPQDLLVIRPTGQFFCRMNAKPERFYDVNVDIGKRCSNFILAAKHRERYLQTMNLKNFGPTTRFNIGPAVQVAHDGTETPINEIIHMWTPRE